MARRRQAPDTLARALARAGVMPLGEAEDAIRQGRVTLNRAPVRQPLTSLRPDDDVRLDGRRVALEAQTLAVMLHKPKGCVTTASDPSGRPTVFEVLLRAVPKGLQRYGWHAIGRLDLDTTGLLLFTNDEHLVAHATSPQSKLPKRYRALVHGSPTEAMLAPLRRGLKAGGEQLLPAKVRIRGPGEVEITLTQGRFHQVKRMLGAVGLPVLALHREAIGLVELDVPERAARILTHAELERGLGYSPRTWGSQS
jgi:pseudouridine synthase